MPTESIFVTSSYVKVPPIETLPVMSKFVVVVTPDTTNPLETVGAPFASLLVMKFALILDIIF